MATRRDPGDYLDAVDQFSERSRMVVGARQSTVALEAFTRLRGSTSKDPGHNSVGPARWSGARPYVDCGRRVSLALPDDLQDRR